MRLKTNSKTGGILPFVVTVIAFGILVPWWKGLESYDPLLLLVSLLVPLVFVTPIATEEVGQHTPSTQAAKSFLYTSLMTLLIAFHTIVVVNVRHWFGHILLPPVGVLLSGLLTAVVAEGCLACFAVWLLGRTNAVRVRLVVRVLFFALLITYLYLFRFAPPELRSRIDGQMTSELLTQALLKVAAVLAVAAAGFAVLLRRNVRRV